MYTNMLFTCLFFFSMSISPFSHAWAQEFPLAKDATFVEQRFTVTHPSELGYIVEAVLKTVDRLGIDIKLTALTFGLPSATGWNVEYGPAIGNHKGKYTYQKPTRPRINLIPQPNHPQLWRDPSFVYTLEAGISFLGLSVSLGPVHAYQADVSFAFQHDGRQIYIQGDALLPASEAQALDFMTDLKFTKVNALFVAGLRCKDICAPDICEANQNTLPQTGLDVIQCNPQVQPIGTKDFGKGPEKYYKLGLEFFAKEVANIHPPHHEK